MKHRYATMMLCLFMLLLSLPSQAHRFAPSLLRIVEVGDQVYQVVWKTPGTGDQRRATAARFTCQLRRRG